MLNYIMVYSWTKQDAKERNTKEQHTLKPACKADNKTGQDSKADNKTGQNSTANITLAIR